MILPDLENLQRTFPPHRSIYSYPYSRSFNIFSLRNAICPLRPEIAAIYVKALREKEKSLNAYCKVPGIPYLDRIIGVHYVYNIATHIRDSWKSIVFSRRQSCTACEDIPLLMSSFIFVSSLISDEV